MNQDIWKKWIENIDWILEISKKREWAVDELVIKDPVTIKQIEELERGIEISYPDDFKEVLTKYSAGIFLNWQIEGEETEGEFRQIFRGGGGGYLWDFYTLKDNYENYKAWTDDCFSNTDDEYDKVWHNKIPFIDVPNGDVIAFGEKINNNQPVIYLSHDDGELHGCRLGENFVDFITRWTNIGCVGTEDWQFEPFFEHESNILKLTGSEINKWKEWLNK